MKLNREMARKLFQMSLSVLLAFHFSSATYTTSLYSRISGSPGMCIPDPPEIAFGNIRSLKRCLVICTTMRSNGYSCIRINFRRSNSSCDLYSKWGMVSKMAPTNSDDDCVSFFNMVCPQNFSYLPDYNKCYKMVFDKFNYNMSMAYCNSLDPRSHVILINDSLETNAIDDFINSSFDLVKANCWKNRSNSVDMWTCGRRIYPKKSPFVWEPFPGKVIPIPKYSHWYPGEPNFANNNETCLAILQAFWNDDVCVLEKCVLCEVDIDD